MADNTSQLQGKIEKIIYSNSENGYFVASFIDSKDDKHKIVGYYITSSHEDLVDTNIKISGEFEKSKYGDQFKFVEMEMVESPLFFFLEKVIKGVGKSLAKKIVKEFSEEELEAILDNEPEKLLSISGISEKKLIEIENSWNKFKNMKELSKFLLPFGVTQLMIISIYQTLNETSDDLVSLIKENPYILTIVDGIGFKKCDKIALSIGFDKNSPLRYRAAVYYVIEDYSNNIGNSVISYQKLLELVSEEIENLDISLFNAVVDKMVEVEKLKKFDDGYLTTNYLFNAESFVYEFVKKRQNFENKTIIKDIDSFMDNQPIKLSEKQKEAIKIVNSGVKIFVLAGYAGSGKTTVSKMILQILDSEVGSSDIMCCALSGIASQRIHDLTGYPSATIQSLLIKHPDSIPYKVLLIDECSMINSSTFYQLFKKIDYDTKIVLVGDNAQLPPIGAGNIFSNLIDSSIVKVVKLDKIFRQSEKQAINFIANQIREGIKPNLKEIYDDFMFIGVDIEDFWEKRKTLNKDEIRELRNENNNKILDKIKESIKVYKKNFELLRSERKLKEFITYIQLISPMKNGILGIENLNKVIQNIFNPLKGSAFNSHIYQFRINDKVLHTKNINMMAKYKNSSEEDEIRVYNGMIGVIEYIDLDESVITVYYPNDEVYVDYSFKEASDLLSLAYAITIHKSQGMEYDNLIIPMSISHYNMLNRELFYTAVTRAKHMLYLIGEESAINVAIKREGGYKRETVFKKLENKI